MSGYVYMIRDVFYAIVSSVKGESFGAEIYFVNSSSTIQVIKYIGLVRHAAFAENYSN